MNAAGLVVWWRSIVMHGLSVSLMATRIWWRQIVLLEINVTGLKAVCTTDVS